MVEHTKYKSFHNLRCESFVKEKKKWSFISHRNICLLRCDLMLGFQWCQSVCICYQFVLPNAAKIAAKLSHFFLQLCVKIEGVLLCAFLREASATHCTVLPLLPSKSNLSYLRPWRCIEYSSKSVKREDVMLRAPKYLSASHVSFFMHKTTSDTTFSHTDYTTFTRRIMLVEECRCQPQDNFDDQWNE